MPAALWCQPGLSPRKVPRNVASGPRCVSLRSEKSKSTRSPRCSLRGRGHRRRHRVVVHRTTPNKRWPLPRGYVLGESSFHYPRCHRAVTSGGGLEIVPVAPLAQKNSGEIETRSPTENLVVTTSSRRRLASLRQVPSPSPEKSGFRNVAFPLIPSLFYGEYK